MSRPPALGGLAGLPARLSLQLKIIFSKNVFGFHLSLFNVFPWSIMVASVDVPSAIDSCEPLEMGEVRRRDRAAMEEFNPMMQKPDPAGSYCEAACRNNKYMST